MWAFLSEGCRHWSTLYADSATLRTVVGFAHVAGLLIGGGTALAEDRAILGRPRAEWRPFVERTGRPAPHGVVLFGLAMTIGSGLLLFAADPATYLHSGPFWTKMTLVMLLMINGAMIVRAERDRTAHGGTRRQWIAAVSLTLWLLVTFAGMALPNV